jgi:hypothetical protein
MEAGTVTLNYCFNTLKFCNFKYFFDLFSSVYIQIPFSDELYIDITTARSHFVRCRPHETIRQCHTVHRRLYCQRVMLWGAFSASGPGPVIHVSGDMTASKYIDVLSQHVIPQLDGQDLRNQLTLQHDNAPPHKAQATIKFLQDNGVDILDWPAFSPDLNPIEKL